jgi:hypothetical protein
VLTHQITPEDAGEQSPDLVGGVVFTRGRAPLPTWHTMRPLIALAAIARDPRLTPDREVPAAIADLRPSLRFLLNLMVSKTEAAMLPEPDRALGGVREALWSPRITPETASMALLSILESLEAADRAAARTR